MSVARGLSVGGWQTDQMRPITGNIDAGAGGGAVIGGNGMTGAFKSGGSPGYTAASGTGLGLNNLQLDSSRLGVNFNGTDTHPISIICDWQMKMYGTISDEGTVSLAQMIAAMAGKLSTDDYNTLTFGIGQSLQDVKAQRQANVVYTNSTAKPIFVAISSVNTAPGGIETSMYVGSIIVSRSYLSTSSATMITQHSSIVPPGSTYKILPAGIDIRTWIEFR